jgi:hypothetical protein
MATSSSPRPSSAPSSCSYFAMSPGPSGGRDDTAVAQGWASKSARFSSATAVTRRRQGAPAVSARGIRA